MKVDSQFEAFCKTVPGIRGVTLGEDAYILVVKTGDFFPVRRAVYRWMSEGGRTFSVDWASETTDTPSAYDPMDRAISQLTYIHKSEYTEDKKELVRS